MFTLVACSFQPRVESAMTWMRRAADTGAEANNALCGRGTLHSEWHSSQKDLEAADLEAGRMEHPAADNPWRVRHSDSSSADARPGETGQVRRHRQEPASGRAESRPHKNDAEQVGADRRLLE